MPHDPKQQTIFIAARTPERMAFGRFALQRDEGGPFVVLPGDAKIYLSENLIQPGKATGADFLYACPVQWKPPNENKLEG